MKSLSLFLSEVFQELQKVQWPNRSEFLTAVTATLVVVCIFSIFFAFVDGAIGYAVKSLILFFAS